MAFGFTNNLNNVMAGSAAGGVGGLTQGPDLPIIQTEGLGFLALAGDAKVQLTARWSPLPVSTASLLSIASRKGLVAAAGPDALHIATTESVRKAFESEKTGDTEARPFNSQAKVPLPVRISQLAFTADEQYLILSAETGGGLAVYDVQSLTQGDTQSAFELNTNGETLRALIPNPMPELASYVAIVTTNGNLYMANLAERKLVPGVEGPALRAQVSSAAWSTKGKQLVAGMADGSIHQMLPDGTAKGHIPKPPSLGNYHVSSVTWLENHVFLAVHNPTSGQDPSVYHIITRQQPPVPPSFTFQKLSDPVEPFGSDKVPHHSVLRLKDFPPNLQDLLLVSSTATESIGMFSRSKSPLTSDQPVDKITNVFTMTELADDSRRAQLPMGEDLTETFPVGSALDLSGKEKVYKPIPTDELDQSPGPLPAIWILNNEGVLASWWVVYNESVRSGTTYPGITEKAGEQSAVPSTPSAAPFGSPAPTAFGTPAAASASPFGTPARTTPAFGGPAPLGASSSPWAGTGGTSAPALSSNAFGGTPPATAPSFGTPSFGAKASTPAFGQSSVIGMGMGNRASPWASGSPATATPAFGQVSFSSAAPAPGKVFGSAAPTVPASGGFANFASKGGFASLSANTTGSNIFASKPAKIPEVSMGTGSVWGAPATHGTTAFPPLTAKTEGSPFGASPFVLGTTFKADPKAADDSQQPKEIKGVSLFGSNFGLSLSDASKQPAAPEVKDEDMGSNTPALGTPALAPAPTPAPVKNKPIFSTESTTPTTTPAPARFDFKPTSGPTTTSNIFCAPKPSGPTNIFGAPKPAPADDQKPKPFSTLFGTPKPAPAEEPKAKAPPSTLFGTPKIKQEDEDKENLAKIPVAPLQPDTTTSNDAPLPPDFLTKPKAPTAKKEESAPSPSKSPEVKSESTPETAPLPAETQPLPQVPGVPDSPEEGELSDEEDQESEDQGEGEQGEEDQGDDDQGDDSGTEANSEGSGIDVGKDISITAGFGGHTPGFTPQSSFGKMGDSTFSTISRSEAEPLRTSLFGEIGRNAPPLFPKPMPQSPRSPSPVRGAIRPSLLGASAPRSVSAPGMASQIPGRRAPQPPSALGFSPSPSNSVFGATHRPAPLVDPNVEAQRQLAAKKAAEARVLVDPEDDIIQRILNSEIQPTLHMDEFLAVDSKLEVVTTSHREEVPVACETLWRDVNRMIDRLGLNSRSLQSFIGGHTTQFKDEGRSKHDLESPDGWVLVEAEELSMVIDDELARDLEEGRIKDVKQTIVAVQNLSRDLAKLRLKEEDMRKIIMPQVDPDQIAVTKSLPLSAEQATQQNELRRAYATFSTLLAETEEALTMLKAKITSAGGASGKAPVPTVEAIIRTINKMTSMAEKRSGDIDVLENQMRRLRFGSMGLNGSPGPRNSHSREGSPFPGAMTPQKKMAMSLMSPERMRDSLGASYGARGTPPRKKISMYTEDEKTAAKQKAAKRKGTLRLLRASLAKTGPNVSRLRDDD